jgi:hypothetical protein
MFANFIGYHLTLVLKEFFMFSNKYIKTLELLKYIGINN